MHGSETPCRAIDSRRRVPPVVVTFIEGGTKRRGIETVTPHRQMIDMEERAIRPDVRVDGPCIRRPIALGDGGLIGRPQRRRGLDAERRAGAKLRHPHPAGYCRTGICRENFIFKRQFRLSVRRVEVETVHVAHRLFHAVRKPRQPVVKRHHQREIRQRLRSRVFGERKHISIVVVMHLRRRERQSLDPRPVTRHRLKAELVKRRSGQVASCVCTAKRYPFNG